ncbi:ABC transporter ATP-binding protein [Saccharopolyspora gloriosae]|uniref:ABC-2 type transport system ATP-binding protein n=1 Tax=Saccharopolyspora gloriosae TaxID=455344 RepID=A0A840NEB9_9PSEU|nr:ABC transporter ATP-binding protein [Saccharopolyspora gloriosae]MBB5069321.1 ABC-2 type transport system ATP-binding protein [Saccharopolyspora gloriosae]
MTALHTTALSKSYGTRTAVADCTVDLPEGKVIGLVGANGAGKSTFLALAAGLVAPTSGSVRIFGEEVRGGLHPRASYLPQRRALYPDFTVDEMIRAVGAMNRRWSRERVEEALAAHTALDRGAKVGSLSPGVRTRLALALGLGRMPDLLLLDEPLSDLDPLARDEVLRSIMADVAERGTTVVLSSHLLGELREVCDHVLLLHDGRVHLDGDVDELLADHRDLVGPADGEADIVGTVIHGRGTGRQRRLLVRDSGALPPGWEGRAPELESLVTDYLRAARDG